MLLFWQDILLILGLPIISILLLHSLLVIVKKYKPTVTLSIIQNLQVALYLLVGLISLRVGLTSTQLISLPFDQWLDVLIILAWGWLGIRLISLGEFFLSDYYTIHPGDNLRQRRIQTQLQFIRRLLIGLIVFSLFIAILLNFETLRTWGWGLLSSAGIASLFIGFATRNLLANLASGFQIAFTQPIRLEDVVIIEGELGKVDEISLTYVVIKVWDERRLILPISYFLENPFQNLTRETAQLMGVFFLYVNYATDIEKLRAFFMNTIQTLPLWDKRAAALEVTDFKRDSVQIRVLVSTADAADLWQLQCALRERLLTYLQQEDAILPQQRIHTEVKSLS